MKIHLQPITLILAFAAAIQATLAITTDELASYLGVSSWNTTIDLPPESFIVEIYTIKDGAPNKRLIEGMTEWSKAPEKGITFMIGSVEIGYKVVVKYGGGVTMTAIPPMKNFTHTMSSELPDSIGEGDHVLIGKPYPDYNNSPINPVSGYSEGFLVRVTKKG